MTRFSRRQRDFHGFRVPHFADHYHVRRLTQGGPERRWKVRRIDANLDLLDNASLVLMFVFDRILNVTMCFRVAPVDLVTSAATGVSFPIQLRSDDTNP